MTGTAAGSRATGRTKRRPGRPSLSNEELLDAALELFVDKGFDGTSIDAITASAGMAKRTVYARYGDKLNLFKAALNRAISQWIVPIERLRAVETDDVEETLIAVGHILLTNLLSPEGMRLLRLTNAEALRLPEISAINVRLGTDPTLAYLQDLLERHFGKPGRPLENADRIAQVFLNMVVGGPANNTAWGLAIAPDEVDAHVRFTVGLFLHGMFDGREQAAGDSGSKVKAMLRQAQAQLEEARALIDQAGKLS